MFQKSTAKIRVCIGCSAEMTVYKNSGRKWCDECRKVRQREASRKYYENGTPEARKKATERLYKKLAEDVPYRLYTRARGRAKEAGLAFNLVPEDIRVPEVCPVLKTPFEYRTYYTASIDRIDSTKGYTKDNIQVLSHKANAMKNSATPEELLKFADWVNKTYLTRVVREPDVPEKH